MPEVGGAGRTYRTEADAMEIEIAGRPIGAEQPMYVVAELSANHCQDLEVAVDLVRAAAEAGADAVKLQTYRPETITLDVRSPEFRVEQGSPWQDRYLWDLYEEAFTPWEWHTELMEVATEAGVHLFSTPFDASAVDFLEGHDVPAYKVASFELIDHGLIQRVAATGKPVIISTGMATMSEIEEAFDVARRSGAENIALMRCNSGYPARPSEMDLRAIPHMRDAFGVPIGLSDHTIGLEAALTARALGACILEKHFAPDRSPEALDASFSLVPDEFSRMVSSIRAAEQMLGEVRYGPTPREQGSLRYRRSLLITADLDEGEVLTSDNVRSLRPAIGLPPKYLPVVLGATVRRQVRRGTPVTWDLIIERDTD
jgi:pseudaminic acid synthase